MFGTFPHQFPQVLRSFKTSTFYFNSDNSGEEIMKEKMTAICSPLHNETRNEEAEFNFFQKKKKKGQARGDLKAVY